jgi:hypothetical protein
MKHKEEGGNTDYNDHGVIEARVQFGLHSQGNSVGPGVVHDCNPTYEGGVGSRITVQG